MSNARLRRVNKEIAGTPQSFRPGRVRRAQLTVATASVDCKNDKSSRVHVDLVDNFPYHLKGSFVGPEGTPYEGGHFVVVRFFPSRDYAVS